MHEWQIRWRDPDARLYARCFDVLRHSAGAPKQQAEAARFLNLELQCRTHSRERSTLDEDLDLCHRHVVESFGRFASERASTAWGLNS